MLSSASGAGTGMGIVNRQSLLSVLNMDGGVQTKEDEDVAANVKTPTATTSSPSLPRVATPISVTDVINSTQSTPNQSVTPSRKHRPSTKIKIHIRDFAFKKSDDRYRGVGSDVPKPNRFARLNKKLGGSKKVRPSSKRWSTASESPGVAGSDGGEAKEGKERRGFFRTKLFDDEEEEEDEDDDDDVDDDNDGWFKRGMGRFSWAFGLSNSKKQVQSEEERPRKEAAISADNESYPSRDEMEFNFGGEDYTFTVSKKTHRILPLEI